MKLSFKSCKKHGVQFLLGLTLALCPIAPVYAFGAGGAFTNNSGTEKCYQYPAGWPLDKGDHPCPQPEGEQRHICHGHRCPKQPFPIDAPAPHNNYQVLVYGEQLDMNYGGSALNFCHHFVHFSYDPKYDGHIKGFAVFGPGNPAPWGEPANAQINAGYHYVPGPGIECLADKTHKASDFKLWLVINS